MWSTLGPTVEYITKCSLLLGEYQQYTDKLSRVQFEVLSTWVIITSCVCVCVWGGGGGGAILSTFGETRVQGSEQCTLLDIL